MSTLLQSQSSRLLQQLCLRYACYNFNAASVCASIPAYSLVLAQQQQQQKQQAGHQGSWTGSGMDAVRGYADAPEPMIVPLKRQQTAPQQQSAAAAAAVAERNKGPWELVQDKSSGGSYWWNQATGVTTPVGAAKPDAWVAIVDKKSGLTYYWNQDSGDTTAVGEPLPGPEGRLTASSQQQQQQVGERPGAISMLGNSLAVGFGIGLVFGVMRLFL